MCEKWKAEICDNGTIVLRDGKCGAMRITGASEELDLASIVEAINDPGACKFEILIMDCSTDRGSGIDGRLLHGGYFHSKGFEGQQDG